MNGVMLVVAAVAALNPFRTRIGLPDGARGRARPAPLGVGGALGAATLVALAWASGPMLRLMQVTTETFMIAAGLVAVLAGAWALGFPRPADEPEGRGRLAGVWPVAYPRIVSPETIAVAVALGARSGVAGSGAALVAAVALLAVLGAVPRGPMADGVLAWLGRLTAAALVLVGVWLMIEGIRDV